MAANNIVQFPGTFTRPENAKDLVAEHLEEVSAFAEAQAEADVLWGAIMNVIEEGGHMDHFLESEDPAVEGINERLILLREAFLNFFCFINGLEHELDPLVENLWTPLGIDDETLNLHAEYDTKYLRKLIEMTQSYISE